MGPIIIIIIIAAEALISMHLKYLPSDSQFLVFSPHILLHFTNYQNYFVSVSTSKILRYLFYILFFISITKVIRKYFP
jgi:hypothetical protein